MEATRRQSSPEAFDVSEWDMVSSEEDLTATVKNTFIAAARTCTRDPTRRRTVPSCARLCVGLVSAHSNGCKAVSGVSDCEISTDTSSDTEDDLEENPVVAFTHQKTEDLREQEDIGCHSWPLAMPLRSTSLEQVPSQKAESPEDTVSLQNCAPMLPAVRRRLPPGLPPASVCQEAEIGCQSWPGAMSLHQPSPQPASTEADIGCQSRSGKEVYKLQFDQVIGSLVTSLQASGQTTHIDLVTCAYGWSVVVQPLEQGDWQTEHLLTIAKTALLGAAAQSNGISVMGPSPAQPFKIQPQGFTATLGAMEKSCHQHPVWQALVQVLVESSRLTASSRVPKKMLTDFKRDATDFANAVAALLGDSSHTEHVKAFADSAGWTVEVTTKDTSKLREEVVLTLAQNVLLNVMQTSSNVCVVGHAARAFAPKSNGFVCLLGHMRDRSKACWDLYAQGSCSKDCACRRDHPGCLIPINIVVKQQ